VFEYGININSCLCRSEMNGAEMNGTEMNGAEMNEIITLFANFINYLNVSCYEYHFTYTHQLARLTLNMIFNEVSKTLYHPPTLEQCVTFYKNVRILEKVSVTDDPDYITYKRLLRRHIAALTPIVSSE
jgi:hypothetical protein